MTTILVMQAHGLLLRQSAAVQPYQASVPL